MRRYARICRISEFYNVKIHIFDAIPSSNPYFIAKIEIFSNTIY